jgi:hypothetical protein
LFFLALDIAAAEQEYISGGFKDISANKALQRAKR